MKEILQIKYLNLKSPVAYASAHVHLHSCHVENVVRVPPAIEVEEPEAEYQEEQLPGEEHEVADQAEDQGVEFDFANSESQQGKHRFILNPELSH